MKKLFQKFGSSDEDKMDRTATTQSEMPAYYREEPGDQLGPEMRDILLTYSGVPEDELMDHLRAARSKAWSVSPYPCVGQWSFLQSRLRLHSSYGEIVENARSASPGTFLVCDVGTGMGQELRCLAADGVPSQNLRAIDITDSLWKCGFDLFRDKDKLNGTEFLTANILEISRKPIVSWKGTLDVIIAGLLLHCFDYDNMNLAAQNLAALTKKRKGSLIVGWQLGGQAVHIQGPRSRGRLFLHTEQSFKDMWKRVGEKAGETWLVTATATPLSESYLANQKWLPPGTTRLTFTAVRD